MEDSTQKRKESLSSKNVSISCVVPAFNEAPLIRKFLQALETALLKITHTLQIIVVDDGSSDTTAEEVESLLPTTHASLHLLSFSRNFGKEKAITAGLEHATNAVTVIIDADFEHPIGLIETFLEKWASGFDMVYAARNDRSTQKPLRALLTRFFYKILKNTANITIPENAGDFRLLDKKVVYALNQCQEKSRFMKGLYAWVGYSQCQIYYTPDCCARQTSHFSKRKLLALALTGFISFSTLPLRAWIFIGTLLCSITACATLFLTIQAWLTQTTLHATTAILLVILFLSGTQFISLGILGEYIAKILSEVQKRPNYLLKKNIKNTLPSE